MKESILVPLDGSAMAEMALPHALALARLTERSLTLLRVVPPPVTYGSVWGAPVPASVWEGVEKEPEIASGYLTTIAACCSESREVGLGQVQPDIEVRTHVLEGDPASVIIEYAEQHPWVTTIVMATHGRRGLDRWVFGSVAESIVHAAPVPLLLVRATEEDTAPPLPLHPLTEAKYSTVVVPLDGSAFAEMALEQAQRIAATSGARLVLVSALPDTPSITNMLTPYEEQSLWDREYTWRDSYLGEVKARLYSDGLEVETHIIGQLPADAILALSGRERADLIVMSTHGRGGLRRLWLGSVASDVVRRSSRPVLLVRPKVQEEQPPSKSKEEIVAIQT